MRKLAAALLCLLLLLPATPPAHADVYHAKPKLVVVIVIDQFRGDYLERYRDDFKTPNGFNIFLKRGAYFTDCYYDYANTITAPGHSDESTVACTTSGSGPECCRKVLPMWAMSNAGSCAAVAVR